MRLIDIEDEPLLKTVSVGGLSAKALWRLIKSQRTIKAIPIEWIKDKMDELEGTGRFELSEYLVELLEDWEKENDGKDL